MCKMLKQYSDKIKDSAASRRLAHIQKRSEIAAKSYQDWGGYFLTIFRRFAYSAKREWRMMLLNGISNTRT